MRDWKTKVIKGNRAALEKALNEGGSADYGLNNIIFTGTPKSPSWTLVYHLFSPDTRAQIRAEKRRAASRRRNDA